MPLGFSRIYVAHFNQIWREIQSGSSLPIQDLVVSPAIPRQVFYPQGKEQSLGHVWNIGISQESRRNFTGISSISQEKRRNGKKNPAFQTDPYYMQISCDFLVSIWQKGMF